MACCTELKSRRPTASWLKRTKAALALLWHRGPELAIQNVGVIFHVQPGAAHLVFVRAQHRTQRFQLAPHAAQHLADGIHPHFTALETVKREADGQMLRHL